MHRSILSMLFTVAVASLFAGSPIHWSFATKEGVNGQNYLALRAVCDEGWHFYALTLPREDGPLPTMITVAPSPLFTSGTIIEPHAIEVEDPNFLMLVRYHGHDAEFLVPIERLGKDAFNVTGNVMYMCCNDKTCLPPVTVEFSVPFPAVK